MGRGNTFLRIFLMKMLMLLQQGPDLEVRPSHLLGNLDQPQSAPPPAMTENGCFITYLQTWLRTNVGVVGPADLTALHLAE